MTLFPLLQAPEGERSSPTDRLYLEIDWDVKENRPIWVRGNPKWVTGARAVAAWVANTLHTERFSKDIFTPDYGLELRALAGKPFTELVKQSEAIRYVQECLEINPYITRVRQIDVNFSGAELSLRCAVDTIYGEVEVDVSGL